MAKSNLTDEIIKAALHKFDGSRASTASFLGIHERTLYKRIAKMKEPPAPHVYPILPDGQKLKGVSSLQRVLDPETGKTVLQWVKTNEDVEKREQAIKIALDALNSQLPRVKPVKKPAKRLPQDIMALYPITDYHMGMLAWGEEAGADWDLKIAEKLLMDWIHYAIANSPPASQGVLYQGGDFMHYDSLESVTPRSGHILDADSRPQKMLRVGIRLLRYVIDQLLHKHDTVHVIHAEGNHDPMASAWLREAFAVMYENEPRVTIETRPDPYYCYVWGRTLLLFHHGHLRKMTNIDDVFVRKFREEYGQALKVYAHMGHLHHEKKLESALMTIEQHPTLARADAYASRGGYMSECIAQVINYHKEYGEVGRIGITPEMVK